MKVTVLEDAIPDPPNDDGRYEFIDGEWIDKDVSRRGPPRNFRTHLLKEPRSIRTSRSAGCLFAELHSYFETRKEAGVVAFDAWCFLDAERTLLTRLDIAVWLGDPVAPVSVPKSKEVRFGVLPDIAIEIIGEYDTVGVVGERQMAFLGNGVKEIWHVYTNTRSCHIHTPPHEIRLVRDDRTLCTDLLPGFEVPFSSLFSKA